MSAQLVGLATASVLALIAWPVYGAQAALETVALLAPLGLATSFASRAIARRPVDRGGLRRRLAAIAVLVALQLAAAVALFAGLMFVCAHDAFFVALLAADALASGLLAARIVSQPALADLDAVRHALERIGAGERDVRVVVDSGDELAEVARAVETMSRRLGASEAARRELIAAVSHDLRTPLTSLQLVAEGLEDGIFAPEQTPEKLRLVAAQARALGALINDLFELSRLEAGELRMTIAPVGIPELVRETVEAMRPHAEAGGVLVRTEVGDDLRPARGNPEQLQRVLFNLLTNAIRHTPPDGSVVVRAAPHDAGAALLVEVADSGSGIPPADRERVFEPFVQGSAARGSAGLGLAIARAIVEAHGGRIWLGEPPRSPAERGGGTRVRFSLPVA